MLRFLLIRLAHALITLWVITLVVFVLTFMAGSPVDTLMPQDAPRAEAERLIALWGLDRPLHEQYLTFMGNLIQGDFGDSLKWTGSAFQVVLERLPATLQLGGAAILISVVVGIPLGVIAAVQRNTMADTAAGLVSLLGQSVPAFWLGIILIWIFAVVLGWLPTSGRGGLQHLVLPAIAMSAFQIAALARLTRSSMLEVLDQEYIKLARVKGVVEWKVIWKHAFRNAALVPLTYFGVLIGTTLTGSVVVETVFAWPGTGWLAIEAIRGRDYPVIQAIIVLFALIFLLANFLVDLVYGYVDPRIRYD